MVGGFASLEAVLGSVCVSVCIEVVWSVCIEVVWSVCMEVVWGVPWLVALLSPADKDHSVIRP